MDHSYPSRVSSSFPGVDEVYPPHDTNNNVSTLLKKLAVPVSSLLVGAVLGAGVMRHIDNNEAAALRDEHKLVDDIRSQMDSMRDANDYIETHLRDQESIEDRIKLADSIIEHQRTVISLSKPGDEAELTTLNEVVGPYIIAFPDGKSSQAEQGYDKIEQILVHRASEKNYLQANIQ